MGEDTEQRAEAAGLRYVVDPSSLPWSRRRAGRGFVVLDAEGRPVREPQDRNRIQALAVPPAWTEVRLAGDPESHIQAVGRDAEGRLQYRYHDRWAETRDDVKTERLLALGAGLGDLRERVARDLRGRTVSRDLALASALALLDRLGLRVGYPEYSRETGGRGALTLRTQDIRVIDGEVTLSFLGKSDKRIRRRVDDADLSRALLRLKSAGGGSIFSWQGEDGVVVSLDADDVNQHLRAELGGLVSARDFRTFRASAIALAHMEEREEASASTRKKRLRGAIRAASDFLCNTQAVCRSSYVHPRVQNAFLDPALDAARLFRPPHRKRMSAAETALLRLLDSET